MNRITVPFFISHHGCPHRCVFCDQVKISGSREEIPDEAAILGKIAEYADTGKRKVLEVAFFGGSFTALPLPVREGLLMPLQPLIAEGLVGSVRVSTRPDCIDDPIAESLKKMGVGTVELGAQSMDDDVLRLSGRGHGGSATETAVSLLKGHGLAVGIQLMPGLPGDTPEKSIVSLRRSIALKPDFIRIYPTVVIGGTMLEELYRHGSYVPLTLPEAVSLCKIMLLESMRSNVPVVRIGLQPTDELRKEGVIISGPFHSSFRQLVEAELCLDLLSRIIGDNSLSGKTVKVFCSPSRISDVIGQNKYNKRMLMEQFGVAMERVVPDSGMSSLELIVESGSRKITGCMLNDLSYGPEVFENARG